MRNAGPDEAQAGIKIAGRNISNLRCADETGGRMGKRGSWGIWDGNVHTAIFKKDNQQGPTV